MSVSKDSHTALGMKPTSLEVVQLTTRAAGKYSKELTTCLQETTHLPSDSLNRVDRFPLQVEVQLWKALEN